MQCSILGAWSRATALAQILASNGHKVTLWSIEEQGVININTKRENSSYLPGMPLLDGITATLDLSEALSGAELIIFAVPSYSLREVAEASEPFIKNQPLVLASKGRDKENNRPLSELLKEIFPQNQIFALSGASHAEELMQRMPTGVMIAGKDQRIWENIIQTFQTSFFKAEFTTDILGIQLMGALKNPIALACWIVEGLSYGVNTKALVITKGFQELLLIGELLWAQKETLSSIAGIGDLYVTCSSNLSRNIQAGRLLADGYTKKEISWGLMNMVAEGLFMMDALEKISKKMDQKLPLMEMLIDIVLYNKDVAISFSSFLATSS